MGGDIKIETKYIKQRECRTFASVTFCCHKTWDYKLFNINEFFIGRYFISGSKDHDQSLTEPI